MSLTTSEIVTLVDRFQNRELTPAEWTHQAHLIVGSWYVWHHGAERALPLLRASIRALNESLGVANTADSGYHETVTGFYVHMIQVYLAEAGAQLEARDDLPPDLISELLASPLAARTVALQYYSRDLINSQRARREWVEPDVAPLPELGAAPSPASE